MNRADALTGGAVLALATVALREAARLPFGAARNPGPGFLPVWTAVALGMLALALLGRALVAPPAVPAPADAADARRIRPVAALLLALAAYVALLEPLGYPLGTFLLVLFMLRMVDPQRWPVAVGVAAVAGLGSYLLFAGWLQVPLPPGPLGR